MVKYLKIFLLVFFFMLNCFTIAIAQQGDISYPQLRQKYIPQNTPEATYQLELGLMGQGMYCYDLAIFDPGWRAKGKGITTSPNYKQTVDKFQQGYKVYKEGRYAVIYYPADKNLGPVFLYSDSSGWVIDRTAVWDYIHYSTGNDGWFAYEGNYPYLKILKKVFPLKKVTLSNGTAAYQIQ